MTEDHGYTRAAYDNDYDPEISLLPAASCGSLEIRN